MQHKQESNHRRNAGNARRLTARIDDHSVLCLSRIETTRDCYRGSIARLRLSCCQQGVGRVNGRLISIANLTLETAVWRPKAICPIADGGIWTTESLELAIASTSWVIACVALLLGIGLETE